MIPLSKVDAPPVLVANADIWREEYMDLIAGVAGVPEAARWRYKHHEIRDTLREETHAKCAYCEGRILPVAFDRIEHIFPRAARPELVVTWSNLTLACERCNNFKSDYYDPQEPLLNPYEMEPNEHLVFAGPMVLHQPGSGLGLRTVHVLQLSRAELFEVRAERLRSVNQLIDRWSLETNPQTKTFIAEQIVAEAEPDRPYSATVRAYLKLLNFPPLAPAAAEN